MALITNDEWECFWASPFSVLIHVIRQLAHCIDRAIMDINV